MCAMEGSDVFLATWAVDLDGHIGERTNSVGFYYMVKLAIDFKSTLRCLTKTKVT